jgi:hypothetical protein
MGEVLAGLRLLDHCDVTEIDGSSHGVGFERIVSLWVMLLHGHASQRS